MNDALDRGESDPGAFELSHVMQAQLAIGLDGEYTGILRMPLQDLGEKVGAGSFVLRLKVPRPRPAIEAERLRGPCRVGPAQGRAPWWSTLAARRQSRCCDVRKTAVPPPRQE